MEIAKQKESSSKQSKGLPKLGDSFVLADDILRKDGFHLPIFLLGTSGSVAANYDVVWNARWPIEILQVDVSWSVASTSGTLQLERLRGTSAPGTGTAILSSTISTAGTANTVVSRSGTQLTNARQFIQGDRLALIDGGVLTNLVGLEISIYAKFLGRGDYR